MFHRGYFDSNFNLRLFPLPDFKPNLLKVLEPIIAPDREDILIEIIKLGMVTFGYDSQHEGIGSIFFENVVFELDSNIDFFNGSGEEGGFSEGDGGAVDVDEVFGFSELGGLLLGLLL